MTAVEAHRVTRSVTVARLAEFLDRPVAGPAAADRTVLHDVVDDSRAVGPGDVYVAIPGQRWHGLDFDGDAAAAGAAVVISDRPSSVLPTIVVDDPRTVVGPLAAWFHGYPSRDVRVYGVTGTNGKTSTAHFMEAGLAAAGDTTGLICGSRVRGPMCDEVPIRTTPEAAALQRTLAHFRDHGVSACALEVSSHAITQRRVDGTDFRVMAFSNLSRDHLDHHGTMEAYFAAKASMFTADRTRIAAVDVDDAFGARLAASASATVLTCSTTHASSDVHADDIRCDDTGSRFTVRGPDGSANVRLRVLGPHQVANATLAITSLIADGIPIQVGAEGVSSLTAIPGRCQPVYAGQPFTVIVDHMHNAAGQRALLPYLRSLGTGRLIIVIGATGGRDRGKHRPLGQVAAAHADLVIVTDESPEDDDPAALRAGVLAGARQAGRARVVEEPDRHHALTVAVAAARPGDVVVVAGRGSDTLRRYGDAVSHFDDHAHLHRLISAMDQ